MTHLGCVEFSWIIRGFSSPQIRQFQLLLSQQVQKLPHCKTWLFEENLHVVHGWNWQTRDVSNNLIATFSVTIELYMSSELIQKWEMCQNIVGT